MTQQEILFLGPADSEVYSWLRSRGESVTQVAEPLSSETSSLGSLANAGYSFLISYGYRHILSKPILELFAGKAINLHISYLPWNRGADPNFWSFIDDTPKGVTIHYLDEGIDTGDIIVQKALAFDLQTETLATTYEKLQAAVQALFRKHWVAIKCGECDRQPQIGLGSQHMSKDKGMYSHILADGWNTPVLKLAKASAG